jgi:ribosomal protein S18 acetylase RimI-like enzyme
MTVDTPYALVRRGTDADRQAIVDILTEAFMNDPVVRWLFSTDRGRLQQGFYNALLVHPAAETYLAGRAGASVWLPLAAGETPYEDPPEADVGEHGKRLLALGKALATRHPRRDAHLYLPCMGVVSDRQGTGLGSAMLRHRLQQADADGLPAYLEASSPRSRALYRRHGFTDLGEQVQLADSPPLWPMWRAPKGTR